MEKKWRVLFLCTGNSCRSQMAEGLARYFCSDTMDVFSAGIETHGLNPFAVKAMAEIGIDISGHKSKTLDEFTDQNFDYVVTVCGHANETCPIFPGKTKTIHCGFDDPPKLAESLQGDEKMEPYRRVRDEIRVYVAQLPSVFANS